MKRLLLAAAFLSMAGMALADEPVIVWADEPAVVNDPRNAWDVARHAIGTINPAGDTFWDVTHGNEISYGLSIRLYSFEKVSWPVVKDIDLRAGYAVDKTAYGTLSLDLARLTGQDLLKYAHVGWMGGYNSDQNQWETGPIFGIKVEV